MAENENKERTASPFDEASLTDALARFGRAVLADLTKRCADGNLGEEDIELMNQAAIFGLVRDEYYNPVIHDPMNFVEHQGDHFYSWEHLPNGWQPQPVVSPLPNAAAEGRRSDAEHIARLKKELMKKLKITTWLIFPLIWLTACRSPEKIAIDKINPIPLELREEYALERERFQVDNLLRSTYEPPAYLPKYRYEVDVRPFGIDLAVFGAPEDMQIVMFTNLNHEPRLIREVQTGSRFGQWIGDWSAQEPFETFVPFEDTTLGFVAVREQPDDLGTLILSWDPVPSRGDIYGYRIYVGLESGKYFRYYEVGYNDTELEIEVTRSAEYFFAVSAFNNAGMESDLSDELRIMSNE